MGDKLNVGVNGASGRIGRFVTYELTQMEGIKVVALNDPVGAESLARNYTRNDSTHGRLPWDVEYISPNEVRINGNKLSIHSEKDASKIPWSDSGVKIVEECSGFYIKDGSARVHLRDGVQRVIVSAPATGDGLVTIIMGVNQDIFDENKHYYISKQPSKTLKNSI
ncbi:MAG: glyceraldehyde 3-phosphate dehydrogenase NAD-binding domain-containing protein, partial [Nanoarchaeota archaeon]